MAGVNTGRHFITSLSFCIFIRNRRGILPISVTSFGGGIFFTKFRLCILCKRYTLAMPVTVWKMQKYSVPNKIVGTFF